jgi:N12 class adenine-specific DNA methylase
MRYNPSWRVLRMKAVEFHAQVNPDQTLTVPASVMGVIPVGRAVRVLILVPENEADQEWEYLAAEAFGQGYADADAIYDQLSTG